MTNGHEADLVFGRGLSHKIKNFDKTEKNINQLQVRSYSYQSQWECQMKNYYVLFFFIHHRNRCLGHGKDRKFYNLNKIASLFAHLRNGASKVKQACY